MYKILEGIDSPKTLKKLSVDKLNLLAGEIRELILKKTSEKGSHLGPNLGAIEFTIALHYILNSPDDKFTFDVSHQIYTHKLLTGRFHLFEKFGEEGGASGFSAPYESEHDFRVIGHTSTSIAQSYGLALRETILGTKNKVVAIIGDGSLGGGEALESLNIVSETKENILIVVNDNGMSMANNHGGLYTHLSTLKKTKGRSKDNIFKSLGLKYYYEHNGNDIASLLKTITKASKETTPTVLHLNTVKGFGFEPAEKDPRSFHYSPPMDLKTGSPLTTKKPVTYLNAINEFLIDKIKHGENVYTLIAGAPSIGYEILDNYPKNYIDVGISEQSATSIASTLALNGNVKPYICIGSYFFRRAYDQIIEDITQNSAQVKIISTGAGIYPNTSMTHQASIDYQLFSNLPNYTHLVPATIDELKPMLEFMHNFKKGAIGISQPATNPFSQTSPVVKVEPIEYGKSQIVKDGEKIAIISVGNMIGLAFDISAKFASDGVNATIVNARFINPIDTTCLDKLVQKHNKIITIENGQLRGGFGEKVASYLGSKNDIQVFNFGIDSEHVNYLSKNDLIKKYSLDSQSIYNRVVSI